MEDRLSIFREALLGILSNDNTHRNLCEERLEQLRKEPNSFVLGMIQLLQTLPHPDFRKLAATVLKRYISVMVSAEICIWKDLTSETQSIVKEQLLKALEAETNNKVARILCVLISELVGTINNEEQTWNELDTFLYKLVTEGSEIQRTMAYLTMNYSFAYAYARYETHAAELAGLFATTLTKDTLAVKAECVDALCHLLSNAIYSKVEPFTELLPHINTVIQELVKTGNEEKLKSVIESLGSVAGNQPKYFLKGFDTMFQLLLEIAAKDCAAETEDTESFRISQVAIETVLSVIERLPSLIKNKPSETYLLPLLKVITLFMCAIPFEVEKDWLNPDPTQFFQGEIEEDNLAFGKSAVDRVLSCANRRQDDSELALLSPILLECFNNDKDWRVKNAGFLAASSVGEYMEDPTKLSELVPIMVTHMSYPHPRIRFAAVHCIGQIATDNTEFANKYHTQIMPAFFNSLNDPIARVQRHVGSALCKFIDNLDREILDKYTASLMVKLEEVLKTAGPIVQEYIISAISSIAEATPNMFKVNYYDQIMPFLIRAMQGSKEYKLKKLRGSVIECISILAKVVGKEKFITHAKVVIDSLYQIQENELESDDPQKFFLLTAWERLCLVLKEDLIPYINQLVPSLLKLASTIPGINIGTKQNSTMNLEEAVKELNSVQIPSTKERRKTIHVTTTAIEEKESAIAMLGVMVEELGGYMDKYVEKISEIVLNILEFSGVEDLRTAAANSLKGLIKAIKEPRTITFPEGYLATTAKNYLRILVKAAFDESEPEPLIVEVNAMKDVIEGAGKFLDQTGIIELYNVVIKLIKEAEERAQFYNDNDSDNEEEENDKIEHEHEHDLQTDATQILTALYKTHPDESLCLVNLLYPAYLTELLKPEASDEHKQLGLFFVVDMVEYLGYTRIPTIYPQLVEAILAYSDSLNTAVRQVSLYGIGTIAMNASEFYPNIAEKCYKALIQALDRKRPEGVKGKKWKMAQDNGISSLGKTIRYQGNVFPNLQQLINQWLGKMPLNKDVEEGLIQNEFLADLVLNKTALVLGENGENFEMVMDAFVDVIGTKKVNKEITMKISKALNMLAGINKLKEKFIKYGEDLEPEDKEKLENCFKVAQQF